MIMYNMNNKMFYYYRVNFYIHSFIHSCVSVHRYVYRYTRVCVCVEGGAAVLLNDGSSLHVRPPCSVGGLGLGSNLRSSRPTLSSWELKEWKRRRKDPTGGERGSEGESVCAGGGRPQFTLGFLVLCLSWGPGSVIGADSAASTGISWSRRKKRITFGVWTGLIGIHQRTDGIGRDELGWWKVNVK